MSDTTRRGSSIQTFTGRFVYPLDPRADEIDIEDVAHSLSNQCRFSGHVSKFYSVAQHSVLVSKLAESFVYPESMYNKWRKTVAKWGLLHDASEAYLVDVPRPVKYHLPAYIHAEEDMQYAVAQHFGLPWPIPGEVHKADDQLLVTEIRDLMPTSRLWDGAPTALEFTVEPWTPARAKKEFLSRYHTLYKE